MIINRLPIATLYKVNAWITLSAIQVYLRELKPLIFLFRLAKIPDVLYKLPKLEIIFVNDNKIDSIDATGLQQLPVLATLDLQNNSISQVPPELGLCTQLK